MDAIIPDVQRKTSETKISELAEAFNSKKVVEFEELLGHEPTTEAEQKLEFLYNSVVVSFRDFTTKRLRNRGPAILFKMMATFLSAIVTVLLGIKVPNAYIELTNNVALIISAFMTFIAGLSAATDSHALWVQFTASAERMGLLITEIQFYVTGNKNIEMSRVMELKAMYSEVLGETAKRIVEVQAEDGDKK
jgi:hypothetical protein